MPCSNLMLRAPPHPWFTSNREPSPSLPLHTIFQSAYYNLELYNYDSFAKVSQNRYKSQMQVTNDLITKKNQTRTKKEVGKRKITKTINSRQCPVQQKTQTKETGRRSSTATQNVAAVQQLSITGRKRGFRRVCQDSET